MSFIDSYKRLEKLCNEIYGDTHGLSVYIDEMIGKPNGSYYVSGWNEDLKRLKHYRWIRNQIVHEPNCTEENMCGSVDMQWLDNFYSRIMSTSDPLALYHKARSQHRVQKPAHQPTQQPTQNQIPKTTQNPKQTYSSDQANYKYQQHKKTSSKPAGYLKNLLIISLIVIIAVVLIAGIYYQTTAYFFGKPF